MPEASKVLAELSGFKRFPKFGGPKAVKVLPGFDRGTGEARVVDVIMHDEVTKRGRVHPHPAVGDALAETIATVKDVKAALPNATPVSTTRHVPSDEEKVARSIFRKSRIVTEEPTMFGWSKLGLGNKRVGAAMVVSATDVNGGLKGVETRSDSRDNPVGDTVDA